MKVFRDPWNGGDDHTIRIFISDNSSNTLIINQFVISLNGQGAGWIDIDIIPFLKMTEEEHIGLLNSLSNIDAVEEVYNNRQKEVGFYLKPVIPLFSISLGNDILDLVYDDNYEGGYSIRRIDLLDNCIIETLSTSKDCARFIIETLIEFYDKNKDKV